jgi:transcription initiation factor TFIIIB Brf1 subunit/transcription initiation factor TFIIB
MTEFDPKLTDEDAQNVLARAIELQAESAGALTVAQIREIASELSIPESAVDQALSEYQAAAATAGVTPRTAGAVAPTSPIGNRAARVALLSAAVVGGAFVLLTILSLITRL